MNTLEEVWPEMNAAQRNQLVGGLLGFEPLTQCWIGCDGKRLLITCYEEEQRAKVQESLDYFRRTDRAWQVFLADRPSITDEMRPRLEVMVERRHLRYSDTPGGGWVVVEKLRQKGDVCVESAYGGGWMVGVATDQAPEMETAPTMAEAACKLALRLFAPPAGGTA